MNNKGFGLSGLLLFICFVGIVLLVFYAIASNFLNKLIYKTSNTPNYKNEYTIYMKEHNISLDK